MTNTSKRSVCIVTGECVGPRPSGGIGTAMTGLAEVLGAAGHPVTILYTRGIWMTDRQVSYWKREFRKKGVVFEALRPEDIRRVHGPVADIGYQIPSATLNWLTDRHFDIIHINDTEADGHLALAARRCEIAFTNSLFVLGLHSPRQWIQTLNREVVDQPVSVVMNSAEKFAIANADTLWSPSEYLLDWIVDNGYVTPDKVLIQQYVLPVVNERQRSTSTPTPHPIKRIVFFGRLEERKGFLTFLNALDILSPELSARGITVVFLGPDTSIGGIDTAAIVQRRAAKWGFSWQKLSDLSQPEALNELSKPGSLAVIASPADNSPCTIYEVIEEGIPFVAANAGGIPELIHPEDTNEILFEPNSDALKDIIHRRLGEVCRLPRPAKTRQENTKNWMRLHAHSQHDGAFSSGDQTATGKHKPPAKCTVVVLDHGHEKLTLDTVQKLQQQDRQKLLDIIVVSHGATKADIDGTRTALPGDVANYLRKASKDGDDCFLLHAGVLVDVDQLTRLRHTAQRTEPTLFIPSMLIDGKRHDTVAASAALMYVDGPVPLGCALLNAAGLKAIFSNRTEFLERINRDAGWADGVFDLAAVMGLKLMAYLAPIGEIGGRTRHFIPKLTPARVSLFSASKKDTLEDIMTMAAITGFRPSLFSRRRFALSLLSSRFGAWMPELISLLEKLKKFKKMVR